MAPSSIIQQGGIDKPLRHFCHWMGVEWRPHKGKQLPRDALLLPEKHHTTFLS
ncbi:hypothetical protein FOCG_17556 [Fusarium oxysporum f. sp. radicis-lycopersici 26381]|nr:hypothetical protein FOCG_17556 [Fusarium oxysporum f. sp. radicis-lycopersici 26381]